MGYAVTVGQCGNHSDRQGGAVTISKSDKAIEYLDYARHCLKVVMKIPDQASRVIHREMAAEWFKLADQAAADVTPLASDHHASITAPPDRMSLSAGGLATE
jgi:hypothetical protein